MKSSTYDRSLTALLVLAALGILALLFL